MLGTRGISSPGDLGTETVRVHFIFWATVTQNLKVGMFTLKTFQISVCLRFPDYRSQPELGKHKQGQQKSGCFLFCCCCCLFVNIKQGWIKVRSFVTRWDVKRTPQQEIRTLPGPEPVLDFLRKPLQNTLVRDMSRSITQLESERKWDGISAWGVSALTEKTRLAH